MTSLRDDRIGSLYAYLVDNPAGVTIEDISDHLDVGLKGRNGAYRIVQGLRDLLGNDDTINVPCDPDPDNPRGRWIYRLVGTLDETRAWSANRFRDSERRLLTQRQVMASMVEGTDGRTLDGRRARVWKRHLDRAIEDLADLSAD